jgi:peptidoglycan/LPS O-acetylase OafA/YrhL
MNSASTRVRRLDAVRGVAILAVILHNQRDQFPPLPLGPLFENGWMGVDLFFVLSGFLITGILVDTRPLPRYFTNFYARRCLRIWPLYALMLVFMFVLVPLIRPVEGHEIFDRSSPWWAYPLFLQNLLVPAPTRATGPLSVSWSLAVEEQFYLVWPWFVRYCSLARLRQVAVGVICVSPASRLFLASHGVQLYSNTFCRLDGLMAGALLALAVRSLTFRPSDSVRTAWVALCVAVPGTFVARSLDQDWIVFSLSTAASAAFVYLALFARQRWLQRALTNRFIVYTGTISYGLYLLHKIPFDVAKAANLDQNAALALPLLLLACYAAAALSWHLVEKPFLRLKRLFESKPHGFGRPPHDVLVGREQTPTLSWTSR